jgi:hypothetical protein
MMHRFRLLAEPGNLQLNTLQLMLEVLSVIPGNSKKKLHVQMLRFVENKLSLET